MFRNMKEMFDPVTDKKTKYNVLSGTCTSWGLKILIEELTQNNKYTMDD